MALKSLAFCSAIALLAGVTAPQAWAQGSEPSVYINNSLLERLSRSAGPKPAAEEGAEPSQDLELAPNGQLNSRLYVFPGLPSAPPQAPPAPAILTSEFETLNQERAAGGAGATDGTEETRLPPLPQRKATRPTRAPSVVEPIESPPPLPDSILAEVPEAPALLSEVPQFEDRGGNDEAPAKANSEPPDPANVTLLADPPDVPAGAEPPSPAGVQTPIPDPADVPVAPPDPASDLPDLATPAPEVLFPDSPAPPTVPAPPAPPQESVAPSLAAAPPPPPPSSALPPEPPATDPAAEPEAEPAEDAVKVPGQIAALTEGAEFPEETRLLFEPGSIALSAEARDLLERFAEALKQTQADSLLLRAYASGRDARRMSLNRALEARSYLESRGISPKRVVLRPLGDRTDDEVPDRIDVERLRRETN